MWKWFIEQTYLQLYFLGWNILKYATVFCMKPRWMIMVTRVSVWSDPLCYFISICLCLVLSLYYIFLFLHRQELENAL